MPNSGLKIEKATVAKSSLCWIWLSAMVIVIDQITKYLASQALTLYQPLFITPFFNLTLLHNTGAAFSFFSHARLAIYLFSLVAIITSIILVMWLRKIPSSQSLLAIALSLILGGALGNLIDRIFYGYVIDFFDFHLGGWHFAAFNVADAAISIGAGLLLLTMFVSKK